MTFVELATSSGVSPAILKSIKKQLTQGEHWTMDVRKVTFTPAGISAVEAILAIKKTEPPPAADGPVLLTVRKICLNPRIIECSDGTRHDLRVQVRDGSLFVPRQVIPAVPVNAAAGLYALHGPQPRKKGLLPVTTPVPALQ